MGFALSLELGSTLLASTTLSAFSPRNLFAAGEEGVWYDPSDFTTMFQDSAGTTPVTAVEQPVGKILDKSGRGNHASQSTAASRPVLSARVNLLTYTEQFDNAAWNKASSTFAAPLLTATATSEASVNQTVSVLAIGASYTFTVRASLATAGVHLYIRNIAVNDTTPNGVATFNLQTGTVAYAGSAFSLVAISPVGDGSYYCTCTVTKAGATAANRVDIGMTTSTTGGVGCTIGNKINIYSADLRPTNAGVNLPAYQRVGASTDYDTSGFSYYLKFDGVDDSLATGTITPVGDKAQVFAGVRKLSDAAGGIIAELSATGATNSGSFTLLGPSAAASDYFFRTRGDGTTTGVTATTYTAPITNVLAGYGDISADNAVLRINGSQVGTNAADQGLGNFGAYPLYIGRRGGSTLPFNGSLYSLILRFSATNLDAATISKTETWVNSKTGAF